MACNLLGKRKKVDLREVRHDDALRRALVYGGLVMAGGIALWALWLSGSGAEKSREIQTSQKARRGLP